MTVYNGLLLMQTTVAILCAVFIVVLLTLKASYTSKILLCCASLAFVQNAGYLIELSAGRLVIDQLSQALSGVKIKYLGCAFILTMFLLFIVNYCRTKFPKWLLAFFVLVDLIVVVGIFSYPHTTIYYKNAVYMPTGEFIPYMKITRGVLYYIYIASEALQLICCITIPIYSAFHETEKFRIRNYILIAFGAGVAALPYILQMAGFIRVVDVVPMFTALSTIIFIVGILHFHLFDLAETAEATILKTIKDPVIVLDQANCFVYANDAAKRVFPELVNFGEGHTLEGFALEQYFYEIKDQKLLPEFKIDNQIFYVKYSRIMENDFHVGYRLLLTDVSAERASQVSARAKEMKALSKKVLETLAEAIDAKDKYTQGHSLRVALYAKKLAKAAGISDDVAEKIRYAGLLHDIGKIGIPDSVLNKAGHLTDTEFKQIQQHTTNGGKILVNIEGMDDVYDVALHHHEKYDGTGYPDKLSSANIPYEARIVGIADSYDAMRSNRVYRKGLSKEVILGELKKGRGKQFDPALDDTFIKLVEQDALDKIASMEGNHATQDNASTQGSVAK